MTEVEDHLRAIASYPVNVPSDSARDAWLGGRRRHRRRRAMQTGAGVTVVGLVIVVGMALSDRPLTGRPTQLQAQPTQTVSPSSSAAGSDRSWAVNYPNGKDCFDEQACADRGLDAVGLPDPAPDFPVRRGADSTSFVNFGQGRGFTLVRTFTVAVTPDHFDGNGGSTPTGAEATIQVARDGAFNTANGPDNKIDGFVVTEGTTALGVNAYVTVLGLSQSQLTLTVGGFDIKITGGTAISGAESPLPADTLVKLANSLTHVSP